MKLAIFMTVVVVLCVFEGARLPAHGNDAGNKAQAKALRAKGAQLLREGKQAEAVAVYKKSLKLQHKPSIEAFIEKLEGKAGKPKTSQPKVSKPKAGPKTKGFEPASGGDEIASPSSSGSSPSGPNIFRHRDPTFFITFPDGWETTEGVYGALLHSVEPKRGGLDSYQENIRIVTSELEGDMGTEEYWRPNKKALVETLPDCSVIGEKKARVDGTAAVRAVVKYRSASDGNLTMLLYLFTREGRGYTVSAISPTSEYDRYGALFDQVISGLTFTSGRSR